MIGTLIGLLIALIVLGLLWWAATTILNAIPIAEPFKTVIYVLLVVLAALIVIYVLLQLLGGFGVHVPMVHLR